MEKKGLSHGLENCKVIVLFAGAPEMRHGLERFHSRFTGGWLYAKSGRSSVKTISPGHDPHKLSQIPRVEKLTLAGLEPAIFGSEDQRLIH